MRTLALGLALLLAACATAGPPPATAKKFSMKMYYLALLRRGPAWQPVRTPEAQKLGEGHMANIRRMGAAGKLLIAGPFDLAKDAPADSPVGIFIFQVDTLEEAKALVQTDPTIQAGWFAADVYPWYGPAGLTFDGREPAPR